MALIQCPECGRQVSDRAAVCVQCGYPLAQSSVNDRYTLVLLEVGPDPAAAEKIMTKHLTLSAKEARGLFSDAPTVLAQGLTRREAGDIAAALGQVCRVKAVYDRDAATCEDALCAQAVDPDRLVDHPAGLPLTFGRTVGAILAALALWTAALWLLPGLLNMFI